MQILKNAFLEPQEEFTPIPFWFWNDKLTEKEIIRQIHDFNDKGVNGFVIHPRIGIPREIEYLSDRFMELVTCAVIEAENLAMKVVLYDEAMYPSGSAHGMVVKNHPEYASKGLKISEYKFIGQIKLSLSDEEVDNLVSVQAIRKVSDKEIIQESITKIHVSGNEVNFVARADEEWYLLLFSVSFTNGHIRGIHFGEDDGEMESPASSDLLNKAAVEEFIRITHERYYSVLSKYFGKTIIGIFTDEPDIMGRDHEDGLIPWTDDFLSYYLEQGNDEQDLPHLWFDAGEISTLKRKKYQEAVNSKMEESYYKPISTWCDKHNIALTGHPHESDDIGYLKYFHIPAQDVVWRWVAPEDGLSLKGQHSTMAKCTADSARHRGRKRNGNECFACCGRNNVEWAFSADDMKWYMDWLFVRGVNLLFPHAFFYSIDGSRRIGERPPDVGPNNIWWPYYKQISDYIKRMCYLMTDSVNQAKVAVLCEAHHLPWKIVKPLYENQIEFNYLENELFLSEDCKIDRCFLKIEKQTYKVLIIEDKKMIDSRSLDKIHDFINDGGRVIVYCPDNEETKIQNSITVQTYSDVIYKIDEFIERDVVLSNTCEDLRVTYINKSSHEFFVFINEGEEEINTKVRLNSVGAVERWDAWKGVIEEVPIASCDENRYMFIDMNLKRRESRILQINTKEIPKINCSSSVTSSEDIRLKNNWYLGTDTEKLVKIQKLIPWNEISGKEHYSGTMIYMNQFIINKDLDNKKVELNLGEVYEIAKVSLNGKVLGVQMWNPYIYEVEDYICNGENILIIEVKNTLANKINGLSLNSGLIGPVVLTIYK